MPPCPAPSKSCEQCRGAAAAQFDDGPVRLNESDGRKKVEEQPGKITIPFSQGCQEIQASDYPTQDEETENDAGDAKVDIELHDISDAERGSFAKLESRHLRDNFRTTGGDSLVGPDHARCRCRHRRARGRVPRAGPRRRARRPPGRTGPGSGAGELTEQPAVTTARATPASTASTRRVDGRRAGVMAGYRPSRATAYRRARAPTRAPAARLRDRCGEGTTIARGSARVARPSTRPRTAAGACRMPFCQDVKNSARTGQRL